MIWRRRLRDRRALWRTAGGEITARALLRLARRAALPVGLAAVHGGRGGGVCPDGLFASGGWWQGLEVVNKTAICACLVRCALSVWSSSLALFATPACYSV